MDMPIDQLVDRYIKMRDKVADIKKRHKAELEVLTKAMTDVEAFLLGHLMSQGVTSMKTVNGTPYIQKFTSVTVGDKAEFLQWVKDSDSWDALDVRALKEPIIDYKEKNEDLPPGINYSESQILNVKR